jgi:hypothetical protein
MKRLARTVFWLGWTSSLLALLVAFPRLRGDPQNFVPAYVGHLSYVRLLASSSVTSHDETTAPDRFLAFLTYAALNAPAWLLTDLEHEHEWVRFGSTRDTWQQDRDAEDRNTIGHLFRVWWHSDGRFVIVSAVASALWWFALSASLSRVHRPRRSSPAA